MSTARWQSWHAAFETAGAAGGTARLVVAPRDFAAALADLGAAALGPREQQEACRTGYLLRYDARGRRVVLARTDSEVARQWCSGQEAAPPAVVSAEDEAPREESTSTSRGRISIPPGMEDAEVRSVSHGGNVVIQAPRTKKGGKK